MNNCVKMENPLDAILMDLYQGSLTLAYQNKEMINNLIVHQLLNDTIPFNIDDTKKVLEICNIIYNNTDNEIMLVDDGIYDLLLEKYKRFDPNYQIGAYPIEFSNTGGIHDIITQEQYQECVSFIKDDEIDLFNKGYYFDNILFNDPRIDARDTRYIEPPKENTISKRKHNTEHEHPELVGTLDKCKFVYNKEAINKGVFEDNNVSIIERDFFGDQIKRGIIDPNKRYTIIMELKYDGISIEADCSDIVLSARSRGDTGIGQAADMTPILYGYKFQHREPNEPIVGVKFEAIMTKYNLVKFNEMKGYNYKNCRSAIVGLFSSSDAWKYRDLITLVPLAVDNETFNGEDINGNPIAEIEFMNDKFVSHGCPMKYAIAVGTVGELLYQIHLFQQEAEFVRQFLPFMYDGIVIHYVDEELRNALGRKNYVNKYSVALKFSPLKVQTIFRGYTYTVGQDGSITPMIHYDPVEFYGTIHPKSSGHSYKRFMELNLHVGDIIDVEYMNDVMPYVSKPNNDHNDRNAMNTPPEVFPEFCPICGSKLELSKSGNSIYCTNKACDGIAYARMVNMCAKLNMDGFGEATIKKIDAVHLKNLFEICRSEQVLTSIGFGPVEAANMHNEVEKVLSAPLLDTQLLGAIGFTGISTKTWELILSKGTIEAIDELIRVHGYNTFKDTLMMVKGIGPATVDTIYNEWEYFIEDILWMIYNANIKHYIPITGKKVVATGFRDKELFALLRQKGFDAPDNGSLTKDTDILLVPIEGHTSSKTQKAMSYGIQIIPVQEFVSNLERYM